ncbi:HAD family hydrolase, partial [Acinetobacter baumannii]
GTMLVAVAIDDRLAGHIVMEDPLRADAEELLGRLRTQGIERVLLATGDRRDVAERIAGALGLEGIHAGLTPEGKLALVESERARGSV